QGLRVLEAVLDTGALDFLILCSSTTAITGGLGQADYCAANNVLDAFAAAESLRGRTATISINWDRWREVGMAVAAPLAASASGSGTRKTTPAPVPDAAAFARPADGQPIDSAVLDWRAPSEGRAVYGSVLGAASHWMLDEHRILGAPVLPGTAYLD